MENGESEERFDNKDTTNVYEGIISKTELQVHLDIEENQRSNIFKKDPATMYRYIAVVLVLLTLSGVGLGVGISIGYGIWSQVNIELPTKGEPVSAKPTSPGAEHWIDTPCVTSSQPECPAGVDRPPLLLVSLDGFRADYMSRGLTTHLTRLSDCGTHAPFMFPSFPSVTFPNHYTIATGLYPEHNGLIGNSMYDPVMEESYYVGSSQAKNKDWYHGEPIWNTVMKNGLRSACYFWVGSDVDVQDMRPNYYFPYEDPTTPEQRIDIIRGLLQLPTGKRPDFITLYFNEPDHEAHVFGPNSKETDKKLEEVDSYIADLMDAVLVSKMERCINIIILADHGMANRSCDHSIILGDENGVNFPTSEYYSKNTAGCMMRYTAKSSAEIKEPKDIVDKLKCRDPNVVPYTKSDMPKRLHYMNSPRIEDVLVPVEQGYTITNSKTSSSCDGGGHGYDNLAKQMQALFLAYGPAFQKNLQIEPFQNIELFNMMCDVLGIAPPPNDGEYGSLHHALKNPPPLPPVDETGDSRPLDCPFPDSSQDYEDRLDAGTSGCSCQDELPNFTDKTIRDFDEKLKNPKCEGGSCTRRHAPFGLPRVTFKTDYCHLEQADYVTGYSNELRMPLYTSFTIDKKESRKSAPSLRCVRPDVRIEASSTPACSDYKGPFPAPTAVVHSDLTNLTMGYSYSPELSETLDARMDALITSNMVPQLRGFISDIQSHYLDRYLPKWADKYGGVNVVTGPIFDYDTDGVRDSMQVLKDKGQWINETAVPTHFFAIVTRCSAETDSSKLGPDCSLVPLTFILRNKDGVRTCQSISDHMEANTARAKDVELLTGLRFYPDLDRYTSIRLRIYNVERAQFFQYWDEV